MYAILPTITAWNNAGRKFALARVVWTSGSSPRRVGASMVISEDGEIAGSVSGGCIEGSVIEAAIELIKTGRSCELEFGADNDLVWSVGPACGSTIRVRVEPFPGSGTGSNQAEIGDALIEALHRNRRIALVSTLEDGASSHALLSSGGGIEKEQTEAPETDLTVVSVGSIGIGDAGLDAVKSMIDEGKTALVRSAEKDYFVHVLSEKDRLIIVGATDIAISLVGFARALNFETIVVDPRETFTGKQKLEPAPDRVIASWPQEAARDLEFTDSTYAVVLTHNAKIDDPMLHILLDSPVRYIGALGSRRTHERRKERLSEAGFDAEQIARIHGPVGLDIGSATPGEIALSIMAQIVEIRNRQGG